MTGEDVGFVTSDDLDFIGKPDVIDYCARMMGVSFRKAKMEDNTKGVKVAVIDPITCLKSRLFKLFAYWQDRRHRESVRVKIALRASNHYLRDMLAHEGYRAISEHIPRIKALALTPLGKRVYVEYEIDVLDAIPCDPALFPTPN